MATFKGISHLHSEYSFDGCVDLRVLRDFYAERGFHFLLMSEHIEGLSEKRFRKFVNHCEALSHGQFIVVPGLEFHGECIAINGLRQYMKADETAAEWLERTQEHNTFNVLVHPSKLKIDPPPWVLSKIHAVEVWNVRYDGSRFPSHVNLAAWRRFSMKYPLAPVFGLDFHQNEPMESFYIEAELEDFTLDILLDTLRSGKFRLFGKGKHWNFDRINPVLYIISYAFYYFRAASIHCYRILKHVIPKGVIDYAKRSINGR